MMTANRSRGLGQNTNACCHSERKPDTHQLTDVFTVHLELCATKQWELPEPYIWSHANVPSSCSSSKPTILPLHLNYLNRSRLNFCKNKSMPCRIRSGKGRRWKQQQQNNNNKNQQHEVCARDQTTERHAGVLKERAAVAEREVCLTYSQLMLS